jgi:hypothetical protein
MSASTDIQDAIVELLFKPNALSVNCPVLARLTGDQANDIAAYAAKQGGLCIYVMPVVELNANSMQGGNLVFFDAAEVRVRIIESARVNPEGTNAFDLKDDVIAALHWHGKPGDGSKLGAILSHPLQLAPKPLDLIEGILEESKQFVRILDVIFNATYGYAIDS